MVSTNPVANSSTVRHGLDLLPESAVKISPSKLRLVQRAVSKARARTLDPSTQGENLKGEKGSLVRLAKKIYLQTLVEQHKSGGKHLDMHQPACLGFQYSDGDIYGNCSTPMLLLHPCRGVNAGWPWQAGFDTTFRLSNKTFELMGITTSSLRKRANPVCICVVNQESAIAYENMYTSMEGEVFQLVHNIKLCSKSKICEMCNAVAEEIVQEPMRELLTPPKPNKNKQGKVVTKPFVFELPLQKPLCDNTTKFSKWIAKKKPHLSDKVLFCAAHLTGIA
jgi:hypothetical protein